MKANKEMDHVNGFQVQLDENTLDFDVKKEQESAAKGQGLSPEQLKQMQEAQAKQAKETNTVKSLNEKLNAAKTAADAGDYDTAIAALNEANQMDPTRDLIWFKLGDYYRMSSAKQTDPAEKQKRLDSAVDAYQKAVDIKKAATNDKDPNAAKNLAAYYNNLADALNKAKKIDDAVKTYEMAAQIDPSPATTAQSYFNIGAVLTNAGKADDAIAAFDKCIAADPTRAEAYYQKGVNMLGKATLQGDKMVAVPGTAEAFQKYLELQPTGGECGRGQSHAGQHWRSGRDHFRQEEGNEEVDRLPIQGLTRSIKGGSNGPPFVSFWRILDVTKDYVLAVLRSQRAARYS